jgi:hypothetical protein
MVLPIAPCAAAPENGPMSLVRQHELDRRLRPVFSRSERLRSSALFGRSCQLLDAAQGLERQSGRQRDAGDDDGTVAAIECMAPTLEAIANASLLLSLLARQLQNRGPNGTLPDPPTLDGARDEEADHATRLLFGASQNIRIAAEAARFAAEAVRPASRSAASTPGAGPP